MWPSSIAFCLCAVATIASAAADTDGGAASAAGAAPENDGIFTSNADLQSVLYTEAELVRSLTRYLEDEEKKLAKVKSYLVEYEAIQSAASVDVEKFVGNPLNSYRLIKKMTSDWKEVKEVITSNSGEALVQNLTGLADFKVLKWPSDEDLNGAAVALMRLQDTYQVEPQDLADGVLKGFRAGVELTANDCFELGRQNYNNGDHYRSSIWMQQALRKWNEEEEEKKSVEKAEILEYLSFSLYAQGNMRRALRLTNELLELEPAHPRAYGNKVYYEGALKKEGGALKQKRGEDELGDEHDSGEVSIQEEEKIKYWKFPVPQERAMYEQLCRGEETLTEQDRSKMSCRYFYGVHPFMKIAPVKEEEVFLEPRLVLYHDVITDNELDVVKKLATPRFKRATVQNYKTGELETASYRISKTAWLRREEAKQVENIYQRVHDITGLNMETSEELQVSNYGMGGHYEPHFDFAKREEKNAFKSLGTGNRIATWLTYMSDVDYGGATVFTQMGVTLRPKRGAAAFWYNLFKNGEGDEMTRHAACPVLAGSKWVSNFWLHERGQEFVRPCSTSPFE